MRKFKRQITKALAVAMAGATLSGIAVGGGYAYRSRGSNGTRGKYGRL